MNAVAVDRAHRRVAPAVRPWGPARLTRRGQVVVVAALVLMAFAVSTLLGARSAAVPTDLRPQPTQIVTVESGETLWDIAARVAPGADPRATIEEIVWLNALDSAGDVRVGQRIAVPAGG